MTDQHTATKATTATVPGHRWRNLYFTRSGRTYWSQYVQDTEAEAVEASRRGFQDTIDHVRSGGCLGDTAELANGAEVALGQLTFAIPMPWTGKAR